MISIFKAKMIPQIVLGILMWMNIDQSKAEAIKPYQSFNIPYVDFAPSHELNGVTSIIR